MKKILTLFVCLCIMASMLATVQVSFAADDSVLDFESSYTVAVDKTYPRIEVNSVSYFFPLCTKSQAGVEASVKSDGTNNVFSLGDATSNTNLGSMRIDASIKQVGLDSYSYKLKKVSSDGSYSVAYQENNNAKGEYNTSCTPIPLFTMNSEGKVVNGSNVIVGEYTANVWYTVSITKAQDSTNLWNVVLEDTHGNKIYASTISNGNPTVLSSSTRSVISMANIGSEVYVDDLYSVNSGDEFVFTDSNNTYGYETTINQSLASSVTIKNSGTDLGGYTFANNGSSIVTLSPFTDAYGKKAAKISVATAGTDNTTAEVKIPAYENKNYMPYSLKFRVGVDTLTSELGIRMLLYNGTATRKLPYLLDFNESGRIDIYNATGSSKYDAGQELTEIKWVKDVLYDCELIHDMVNKVFMFYITDTDGTTYGYDISSAMSEGGYDSYCLGGVQLRFRGWSDGAVYFGDAVHQFYTPGGKFVDFASADGAEMVALSSAVRLNYSDYIDSNSVTDDTVTLKDEEGNLFECSAVARGKSIVVTPSNLEKGKTYTISAAAVKNLYGDEIAASPEITFETVRALTIKEIKLNGDISGTALKGNNTISANVYAGDDSYDLTLIAAAYDKNSNTLIKFNALPYRVVQGEPAKDITVPLDLSDITVSDWYVKVFVWNDISTMKPYMPDLNFEN